MKSTYLLESLSLFCLALLLTQITCTRSNLKFSLGITTSALAGTNLSQNELATMWKDLFTTNRGNTCKSADMEKKAAEELKSNGELPGSRGASRIHKGKFGWILKWGYGDTAYLIDFLDPLFQKEAVKEFQKIYDEIMKVSNKDTKEYQDPFDITKFLKPGQKAKDVDLKQFNKNYDPSLYTISANSVQIREIMKKWNWFIEPNNDDYAVNFIVNYDINGDGRLNPRELLLGTIMHNKNAVSSGLCKNCLEDIARKLDAIFIYLDCNNDGFLSAEELWNALPKLQRGDTKWNIFGINNADNIRTSAINDFCIKNGAAKGGSVSRDEWRTGILLAYWDRQTTPTTFLKGDKRSLKQLRWTNGGMVDTVAFKYIKEKTQSDMISKAQNKK